MSSKLPTRSQSEMSIVLDSKIPEGPLADKWDEF